MQEQSCGNPEGDCREAPALVSLSRTGLLPTTSSPLGNQSPGLSLLEGQQRPLVPAALNQTSLSLRGSGWVLQLRAPAGTQHPRVALDSGILQGDWVLGSSSSNPVALLPPTPHLQPEALPRASVAARPKVPAPASHSASAWRCVGSPPRAGTRGASTEPQRPSGLPQARHTPKSAEAEGGRQCVSTSLAGPEP